MQVIAFDTETHPIKRGLLAPRMVCLSWADGTDTGLLLRDAGIDWLRSRLLSKDVKLVGANLPFDLGVACAEDVSLLPLVFEAYSEGRICCIQTRQKLVDIALGESKWRRRGDEVTKASVSLQALVFLYRRQHLEKQDTWRLKYGLLDGIPVREWPEDARSYALFDAKWAFEIFEDQENKILYDFIPDGLPDEANQQRAAWALHLMSMWGVRTDPDTVDRFIEETDAALGTMREEITSSGIFRDNGTKDMAELRRRVRESLERQGIPVPTTPTGKVETSREILECTDDPALLAYARSTKTARDFGQWKDVLVGGTTAPSCARFNVLVATGRTSCGGDDEDQEASNMQNPPRGGLVRSCFKARTDTVFCFVDYDTAELRSLAQVCYDQFGASAMRDHLWEQYRNKGPDLHVVTAANLLGIDLKDAWARYLDGDKEIEDARQMVKAANFGYPGGMGARKMVHYAWKSYRVRITFEQAEKLRDVWLATYPEMKDYFRWISDQVGGHDDAAITQLRSKRKRGGVDYCSAANGFFQGLTADGAKEALWDVSRECYIDRSSPLYGSRPIIFMHDEIITEVPEHRAHEAAHRQAELMIAAMKRWLPDVPVTCAPSLARRWIKGAKPLYVNGRLVPVRAEKSTSGKTHFVEDRLVA